MVIFLNIIKYLFYAVSFLFMLLVFLFFTVWFNPDLVINDKNVAWVYQKYNLAYFENGFPESFHVQVKNENFTQQRIQLEFYDACASMPETIEKICFETLKLELLFDFEHVKPQLIEAGPLTVKVTELSVAINNTQKEASEGFNWQQYVSSDLVLHAVEVDIAQSKIKLDQTELNAALDLKGKNDLDKKTYRVDSKLDALLLNPKVKSSLRATFDIDASDLATGKMELQVWLDQKKKGFLTTTLEANLKTLEGKLNGKGAVHDIAPLIQDIEVTHFEVIKKDGIEVSGDFSTAVTLGSMLFLENSVLPPVEIQSNVKGGFHVSLRKGTPLYFETTLRPIQQNEMKLSAAVKGSLDLDTKALDWRIFNISFDIKDFQKTVQSLHLTQMAIPAPLNDLDGRIHLQVGSESVHKNNKGEYVFPIAFETKLSSTRQRLNTEAKGNLILSPSPFQAHLDLDAALNDIAIVLPKFELIGGVPNVLADPRIVKKENLPSTQDVIKEINGTTQVNKKSDSIFTMDVSIATPDKPIEILYDHFEPAALMRIETQLGGKAPMYKVYFDPFSVSFFHRSADLEFLKISQNPKTQELVMDGRFTVQKRDFLLQADILQENQQTVVRLSSTPTLSQDDIVSLLLFDELQSDLDSGTSDSVEDTRAAIAQKSIGFLSFFLLASTPIQKVDYDPTTGKYSARIKLPGGFVATIGSDWDKSQEAGLRKRLIGRWSIVARVVTNSAGETRQESMLEWFYRY